MRKKRTVLAIGAVALLLASPVLMGHGGGHKPPSPKPPPPTPGPEFGGPVGPGGPNPGPGDTNRRGPTTGRATPGRAGPATPGPSGPATPSGPTPLTVLPGAGLDSSDWSLWWQLNRHPFLKLKEAVWSSGASTGDADLYLGRGQASASARELKPSDRLLAERVAPALRRALAAESQPGVVSSALVALAKLGPQPGSDGGESSVDTFRRFLQDANQQIAETAVLCLGLVGEPRATHELAALVLDTDRGRELAGRSEVRSRTRAFAAYALGLAAERSDHADLRRFAVHTLVRALEEDDTGSHDLAVGCVNGLSLVRLPDAREPLDGDSEPEDSAPPAASSRQALARFLIARLNDRRLADRVRAHVPRALARMVLGADDPLREPVGGALAALLASGKLDRELRLGCVQAAGLLGNAGEGELDRRLRRALVETVRSAEPMARQLALIALAETSSRPDPGPARSSDGAREVRELLMAQLAKGKSRTRPWAALALGVQGFRLREQGLSVSADVSAAVRERLRECRSPSDLGAYALAAGLRGDMESAELLRERLDELSDDTARGHLALALGLLQDFQAIEGLRRMVPEAVYRPDLQRDLAIGLALLGDKQVVSELVAALGASSSRSVQAVYAWTLAFVGDARAIDPLIELLADPQTPVVTRGNAALGLGWLSELTPMPWNARLSSDANYVAAPESFFSPAGGGVLNIR